MSRFWEDGRGPASGDEFSVLAAMTIAMSARNAVEDLHVAGVFSDKQAPALNRRLRNRAYEVLFAVQALADTGHDDQLAEFLADRAALDGQTEEAIEPIAALRGAIRAAVRDFAHAEHLPAAVAKELEATAVDGAARAFQCWQTIEAPHSTAQISYLAHLIPGYWELPEVAPELRDMFGLAPTDA
jgi:hypothetical protein